MHLLVASFSLGQVLLIRSLGAFFVLGAAVIVLAGLFICRRAKVKDEEPLVPNDPSHR
ncbi:hypothetical protein [Rhizobium sp. 2MFCol3.1]|uniref:hypothetical protein n=1 Tax=Rhizobium sp. 2MFCol3.1 TaxID=1246459 RepID=UPI000369F32B|nr:hypothetical protein [Rhizobium sp. 2MFCol3.1]